MRSLSEIERQRSGLGTGVLGPDLRFNTPFRHNFLMSTSKETLTLIQRGSVFYPFKENDYEILNKLGAPYETLDINSFPLLMGVLRGMSDTYDYRLMNFVSLETRLNKQLDELWGESLIRFDYKNIVIQCPRSKLKELNRTLNKLIAFYARFDILIEHRSRASKTKITCKMTKTVKPRAYAVPN